MQKKFFSLFLLIFLTTTVFASPSDFCTPVPYQNAPDHRIVLLTTPTVEKPDIYFFNNVSNRGIFIDHTRKNPGASAGWATYLRPGHWSALILNKKNFSLHCFMIQPGKVVPLNCSQTIEICKPKNLNPSYSLKGNAWAIEDANWTNFNSLLHKKGILISVDNEKK